MGMIEAGDNAAAEEAILNECVPKLDNLIALSKELDAATDEMMEKSVKQSQIIFWSSLVLIIVFIVVAAVAAMQIGKRIIKSITVPLAEIEAVAR